MNMRLQSAADPERQRLEADLAAHVAALFERCPVLTGFSVRLSDAEHGELDLTCYPQPDKRHAAVVFEEVSQMLLGLQEEAPEVAALLPGRTFARTLH